MKFQLPQFIQTEVKLIGPFTLKQFMWVAAGGSMLLVLFIFVRGYLFFFLAIPIVVGTIAFAFIKIDGIPIINLAAYMLAYALNPKKYTYQKEEENNYTTNNN